VSVPAVFVRTQAPPGTAVGRWPGPIGTVAAASWRPVAAAIR